MALVKIDSTDDVVMEVGLDKKIDEGAYNMIIDTVQKFQYSYPIESTVRELFSNSYDAVKEKNIAKDILSGRKKVEDYFIKKEGSQYKDSGFDSSYYNLNNLSDNDEVLITYKKNEGTGYCDLVTIKDEGVGMSFKRLIGTTNIGFSTRRLNNSTIGGFGCGGKVALATEVAYYTIETVHNNKRFKVNCYDYKIQNLISKFNLDLNKENPFELLKKENGSTEEFYYEDVDCKNYTIVTFGVKHINRDKFKQAVRNQLLYFDNLKFKIIDESDEESDVNFKANILYNSESILLSDNNFYSRPHILIVKDEKEPVGISYGVVDFKELEMQEIYSNVAIKCKIRAEVVDKETGVRTLINDGVEVSPSRETIRYTENTRNYIIKQLSKVSEEASKLVEEELKETDIIEWFGKCTSIIGSNSTNQILNRLGKVIDKSSIKPTFLKNSVVKYNSNVKELFQGFNIRVIKKVNKIVNGKYKNVIERESFDSWHNYDPRNIYWQSEETSNLKDNYLNSTEGYFLTIQDLGLDKLLESLKLDNSKLEGDDLKKWQKNREDKAVEVYQFLKAELLKSPSLKNYDSIEVPEDWKNNFEKIEEDTKEKEEAAKLTPEQIRKLEERTVAQTLKYDSSRFDQRSFTWMKVEPKIKELQDCEIVYGGEEDEERIHFLGHLLQSQFDGKYWNRNTGRYKDSSKALNGYPKFCGENFKILKVGKSNLKHFKSKTKIAEYFLKLNDNNELSMGDRLVKWNTGRLIAESIDNLRFLENYKIINEEAYNAYIELQNYVYENYTNIGVRVELNKYGASASMYESFITQCDNLLKLQQTIIDSPEDKETIAFKAKELFGSDIIKGACGVDYRIYSILQELLEYSEPIKVLFNEVKILTDAESVINYEQESFIREILDMKDRSNFELSKHLKLVQENVKEETTEITESKVEQD